MAKYIDIHSHIHDKAFDEDREKLIIELEKQEVLTITVGTDYEESLRAIQVAEESPYVFATIGMHPVDNRTEIFNKDRYTDLALHEKVVAIGECGLDYFRLKEDKEAGFFITDNEEKERQKKLFEEQIEIAVAVGKPLMLHGRPSKGSMDAYEDMIHMLTAAKQKHGDKVKGNFHFFVGDVQILEKIKKLETFTVSFSGVITFAKEYEEVVKQTPMHMIHAETDSPYVAPSAHRGKRNEPLYVEEMIRKIADIKGVGVEEVEKALLENAERVFFDKVDTKE